MNFEIPATAPKHSVWELDVPIVDNQDGTLDVYITAEIMEPFVYSELIHRLARGQDGEKVTLHLNTPGGMVDSAFMLVNAIKESKATVTANLYGTVASAGTIIALACEEFKVADHLAWMAHNYSAGMQGKGHEMKARQTFMDKQLNAAFKEFYQGFYTDDEMEEIIDGKDSWLTSSEVKERLVAKAEFLAK